VWTRFIWLGLDPVAGPCEHGNEPSGYVNGVVGWLVGWLVGWNSKGSRCLRNPKRHCM
jgi:hypothetical protein